MFMQGVDYKNIFPKVYKGFQLLSITEIKECDSIGIYLRHQKTGLEVFHLLNEDEENLFAFAFRTPSEDSTGVAHIIEHSVLCGSQKFPLKEPFTNLMNQSVNTFLNAMTYSDKTVYCAGSTIKKDYYNIMDVYGDAVFFPLLKKEAFMQEAHRLNIKDSDRGDNFVLDGVVLNEMKGVYSAFQSVADDAQTRTLFPDTAYSYDSGGDPLTIPTLTYEAYKDYYHKYYKSDNCLLFLYGNIKTKEQLDFIQTALLDRVEKLMETKNSVVAKHETYPYLSPIVAAMETQKPRESTLKPLNKKVFAPSLGSEGSNVTVQWLCGETCNLKQYLECTFLNLILTSHEASPLSKALTLSKLGKDLSSAGCYAFGKQFFITVGLQGVDKRNEKKVYKVIDDTLKTLIEKGVDKNEAQAALNIFEIAIRENVRRDAPQSINLMEKALNAWNYGQDPSIWLLAREGINLIKESLKDDPRYIEHLIEKYLINNNNRVNLLVIPKKNFSAEREKKERANIKKKIKMTDPQMVRAEREILREWQEHYEDESETKCIPRLELRDLTKHIDAIKTDWSEVKTKEGASVTLLKNCEKTNGITYIEVWIPCDGLSAETYKYLPLFSYCAIGCGATGLSWEELAKLLATDTGGVTVRTLSLPSLDKISTNKKLIKQLADYNCLERDWVIFSLRALSSDIKKSLDAFKKVIMDYEFWDAERLSTLVKEWKNVLNMSLLSNCNRIATSRAKVSRGHSEVVNEIYKGVTQLFATDEISKENPRTLATKFNEIKNSLKAAGALVHVTCDATDMDSEEKEIEKFIQDTNLHPLEKKGLINEAAFIREALLPGEKSLTQNEVFLIPGGVGYSATTFDGTAFGDADNSAAFVLFHYLSGVSLWERIRTKGGAYGASCFALDSLGAVSLNTYRDPNPFSSLKIFCDCLKELAKSPLDSETLKRMIIGTYGEEITPMSPYERSSTALIRLFSAISDKDIDERLSKIKNVTAKDLSTLCEKLLNNINSAKTVVVANKNESSDDKTIVITLPN